MAENEKPFCPECEGEVEFPEVECIDRRNFIRLVGEGTAALTALGTVAAATPSLVGAEERKEAPRVKKAAEELIKELHKSLSDDQKKEVVKPYDHSGTKGGRPTRLGMYNRYIFRPIGKDYTKAQQELIERVIKALAADEEGYRRLSRNGTWDGSRSLQGCGATFFGEPTGGKYAFVFTGHHLTVRCDGDFEDGLAFGGPMYYGHSPNGYNARNVFNFQTKSVAGVYSALDEKQRVKATIAMGNPGEHERSVRLKKKAEDRPGIPITELSKDQKALVEKVMRTLLAPYRKEDADEVMAIIKKTGGMDKIQLAFYTDEYEGMKTTASQPWSFWRLEGPGFVWNFRVLPHVHTYVYISSKLA
jgi:hypothetical protein